jgi:hypothetical protein
MAERAMKKARPTRKILDVVKEREIATVVVSFLCPHGLDVGKAQLVVRGRHNRRCVAWKHGLKKSKLASQC